MISKEHQDLLDRYIRYELTTDEYREVEHLLQNNAEFAREAALMEHITNALDRQNEQKALAEMQARTPKNRQINRRLIIGLSSAAAVILLLLYIGASPRYTTHLLFETYYTPLEQEDIPSRGGDSSEAGQQATILEALDDMESGRTEIAIEKLSALSRQDIIFAADARWYLALLYLQQGERSEARKLLKTLSQTDNIYREQASGLLIKLDKRKWF